MSKIASKTNTELNANLSQPPAKKGAETEHALLFDALFGGVVARGAIADPDALDIGSNLATSDIDAGSNLHEHADILASMQTVAQENSWSLEELEMRVEIPQEGQGGEVDKATFVITGLVLDCAAWEQGAGLSLTDEIQQSLPPTHFKWVRRDPATAGDKKGKEGSVTLPVYLNSSRAEVLFQVDLDAAAGVPAFVWPQRGACLRAWE